MFVLESQVESSEPFKNFNFPIAEMLGIELFGKFSGVGVRERKIRCGEVCFFLLAW